MPRKSSTEVFLSGKGKTEIYYYMHAVLRKMTSPQQKCPRTQIIHKDSNVSLHDSKEKTKSHTPQTKTEEDTRG